MCDSLINKDSPPKTNHHVATKYRRAAHQQLQSNIIHYALQIIFSNILMAVPKIQATQLPHQRRVQGGLNTTHIYFINHRLFLSHAIRILMTAFGILYVNYVSIAAKATVSTVTASCEWRWKLKFFWPETMPAMLQTERFVYCKR